MDLVNIRAANSKGDHKRRRVNKKNKNWHKRLHLRKSGSVQPPAMQSGDKNGPKKIAEEWEQTTVWPSSKKSHQEVQPGQCVTNDGGNTLRFTCSQCKDNLEYIPIELVKHFEEKHTGIPVVFPCYMCTFSTHKFSYLQVHVLSHKDIFSSCAMCGDNAERTWPEYNAHLTKYHCSSGKYSCEICHKFSTGDVRVFLQHIIEHNLDKTNKKHVLKKNKKQLVLRCPYCSFEASRKLAITKHVKAVHLCRNGRQRRQKRGVALAIKQNDTIPGMNSRLTRSAVKEMCWLTQDCLSLPGKGFLDKYCHLSDPQTTLEETQEFLMNSVTMETDDQKWTKALKSVLSNVPQDVTLMENGILSNPSDLAVLTVKNKITVGQNGAMYPKRLKMMPSANKKSLCSESVTDVVQFADKQKDSTPPVQDDNDAGRNLHDVSSVENRPTQEAGVQENRENQELKTEKEVEDHREKLEGSTKEEGTQATDVKPSDEMEETCDRTVSPRCSKQPLKTQSGTNKAKKKSRGRKMKMTLVKNPLKVKLFSHVPMSGGTKIACQAGLVKKTKSRGIHQKTPATGSTKNLLNPLKAITSISQSVLEEDSVAPKKATEAEPQKIKADAEKIEKRQASRTNRTRSSKKTVYPKTSLLQKILCGSDGYASEEKSQAVDRWNHTDGKSSGSLSDVPLQGGMAVKEPHLGFVAQQTHQIIRGTTKKDKTPNSNPDYLRSIHLLADRAIQQESSTPASGYRWHPVPKHQERTLKLVAINPSQLVKHPVGDQPVVVLNHPDADIPQVARIMEIINRHREVQKVVLSHWTLSALSALETTENNQPHPSVQERYMLKLKFRRLNKKKYKIVDAISPASSYTSKFPCWFCGRIFHSQKTMMAHRQRHLVEWKNP